MKKLALLTHVYNSPEAAQGQVDAWATLTHQQTEALEFIIVDDCSDEPLSLRSYNLPLRLFRITTDIPWNMAGAKNLLLSKSTAEWLLFFDVDNRPTPTDIAGLSQALTQLDRQTVYMFPWKNGQPGVESHINTFLVHREVVQSAGGFDEDFCGHYGYEDVYFHYVLQRLGHNRVILANVPFEQGSARTEGLSRDSERNKALATRKYNANERPGPALRFQWIEQKLGTYGER